MLRRGVTRAKGTIVSAAALATLVAAASHLALGISLDPATGASAQGVRVIDRTFSCPVGIRAGARKLEVHATAGTRSADEPAKWQTRAATYVIDPTLPKAGLAWSFAGWPQVWTASQVPTMRAIWFSTSCRLVSRPSSWSAAGLTGGAASPFDDEYECTVSRRVLIRLQATFRSPTVLKTTAEYREADGIVKQTRMVVRSESGKAIALARVSESGRAQLLVSGACLPD